MKITPLFDNVLVKPLEPETKTASGIILPDTAKDKPQIGEVKAIGKGKTDKTGKVVPMVLKVGQKVLYKKWGGNEVKMGSEEWMLMSQEDILATVE
jgi:chaperonin GroES